jgi:hypothetical protein
MSTYVVEMTENRRAQVQADSVTVDGTGALVIATVESAVVIFAARTWQAVYSEHAQVVWTPTQSPAPAARPTPTPRFA